MARQHGIYAYYGRLGQGKTYAMVSDILEALRHGEVVYTNLPINWQGYDETTDSRAWFRIFLRSIGFNVPFRFCDSSNLRRIEVDENFQQELSKITDAIVALDEAYAVFDSYEMAKMSLSARQNVLHTRHFGRSIWYTVQRPTNIHVVMRGVTNVFYRCRLLFSFFGVNFFVRDEFDLGSTETPDEEERISRRWYFGNKAVYTAYDTAYLRPKGFASTPARVFYASVPVRLFWRRLGGKLARVARLRAPAP